MEPNDLVGKTLAQRYELGRLLGRGAFGAVFQATNELGKRFAIKVLTAPHVTQNPELMGRFKLEARAAAAIESAHVVNVYETGVDDSLNLPYLVMELLRGEDLDSAFRRLSPFPTVLAARVITQAALGLERAHAVGVVHRDVKPENIFLASRDADDVVLKVVDFGIAKALEVEVLGSVEASLTRIGTAMGTPLYMSPEQAQGLSSVDERTDVWALGVCLYQALAGKTPWGEFPTLAALCVKICSQDAPSLREVAPWVPIELAAVVDRALARDPNERLPSMRSLIIALAPFCEGGTQITKKMLADTSPPEAMARSLRPTPGGSVIAVAGATPPLSTSRPPRRRKWLAPVAAAILLAGGALVMQLAPRSTRAQNTASAGAVIASPSAEPLAQSGSATVVSIPVAELPVAKPSVSAVAASATASIERRIAPAVAPAVAVARRPAPRPAVAPAPKAPEPKASAETSANAAPGSDDPY